VTGVDDRRCPGSYAFLWQRPRKARPGPGPGQSGGTAEGVQRWLGQAAGLNQVSREHGTTPWCLPPEEFAALQQQQSFYAELVRRVGASANQASGQARARRAVTFRAGPNRDEAELFILEKPTSLMILRECGGYRLARVPHGRTRWLQANVLTTHPPAQERKVGSVRPLPLLDVLLAILDG